MVKLHKSALSLFWSLLLLLVSFVETASASKGKKSDANAAPDFHSFQQVRKATLQSVQSLCEPDPANWHDVGITPIALQFTGIILEGTNRNGKNFHWENARFAIRFADIETIDVKWDRCSNTDQPSWKAVVIELKSQAPAHFLWLSFSTAEVARQFVDEVNWLVSHQSQLNAQETASAERFKTQVAEWRTATAKPAMPEDARTHKVLAENAVQEKDFTKAIDEYEKALEIFATWPEGQFNLALLCGETSDYDCAIEHMQNYLDLVPGAADAQTAKDKIIVWKDKLATPKR